MDSVSKIIINMFCKRSVQIKTPLNQNIRVRSYVAQATPCEKHSSSSAIKSKNLIKLRSFYENFVKTVVESKVFWYVSIVEIIITMKRKEVKSL